MIVELPIVHLCFTIHSLRFAGLRTDVDENKVGWVL